ncbi:MAG: hypothetical protein GF311_24470 [Candidatus Lokiarchaeota archaeon]|nr:hypothetical protein [Candidatus Lokiarchaeota archaeon]
MSEHQKIHIIGYDELVILMGLLGVDGTVVEDPNKFMDIFEKVSENPSINVILIAMDLPDEIIDYLIDFKLNNTKPFIYLMPDIFQEEIEDRSVFLKRVYKQKGKLLI